MVQHHVDSKVEGCVGDELRVRLEVVDQRALLQLWMVEFEPNFPAQDMHGYTLAALVRVHCKIDIMSREKVHVSSCES